MPTGKKRQLSDAPTPEMLKLMRMDPPATPGPSSPPRNDEPSKLKPRGVTVEDVDEDEDVDDPTGFAPGGDADYFAEEDEEGRFFGGGLTDEQKKILNIFDGSGNEGVQDDVRVSHKIITEYRPYVFIFISSMTSRLLVSEGYSFDLNVP